MPVKRKLNRKVTKVPRNVKINSKRSKRASQKKRGRKMSKRQRGGTVCRCDVKESPCYTPFYSGVFGESKGVRINGKGRCLCNGQICDTWG